MALKFDTKFSKVPNTAQYGLADWSHMIEHTHSGDVAGLDAAKSKAQLDEKISFFFSMRDGMSLEKKGYFAPGDNVFFSDVPWLGSAPMSDTYFVARAYDLTDSPTRAGIKSKIDSIKIGTHSADSLTPATPLIGGFIFVDFSDEQGTQPINDSFARITSYTETDGTTKTAADWLMDESKKSFDGTPQFTITFVLHATNAGGSYIRLPRTWESYRGTPGDLQSDLMSSDPALSIPATWAIIYVVLPEGASKKNLFPSQEMDCNWGERKDLEIVYLDSSVFAEANDRDWAVVAHETLHALGLPDLYSSKRSYGWSMMSDCRTAWHLLGWEKLLLGWIAIEDFVWMKSGLLDVNIYGMFADVGNTKGVVLLDESNDFAYVIEAAQPTGRTVSDRDTWNQRGLLFYRVELRSGSAQITPLLHEWADDSRDGGALKAPYPVPAIPTAPPHLHNNILLQPMENGGEKANAWMRAYVAQFAAWKPSESTDMMVCDELIESKSGKYRLRLALDGQLEFQIQHRNRYLPLWRAVSPADLGINYGFFLEVSRLGTVTVSQGTGPANKGLKELWSNGKTLETDHHFLWLVETPSGCHVSIYKGHDHSDPGFKQYDLFDYPDDINYDVTTLNKDDLVYSPNLDYQILLAADGNLTLSKISDDGITNVWWAVSTADRLPKGTPAAGFGADGRFQYTDNGRVIESWPDTTTAFTYDSKKSIYMNVESNGAIVVYQGKGADKTKLYDIRRPTA